jgi:hypothetical protein
VAHLLKVFALLILALCAAKLWRKDGKAAEDTDSMKSKDGFGAQLFLTESRKFFDDWNKPETPNLTPAREARRNIPIFTVILFAGAGSDAASQADVECHVTIRKPDGSVYGEKEFEGLKGKTAAGPHDLQLPKARMGIRIEPDDPSGTYTVEATVSDKIKKVDLKLKTTFKVAK